jgi:hypothetical protein
MRTPRQLRLHLFRCFVAFLLLGFIPAIVLPEPEGKVESIAESKAREARERGTSRALDGVTESQGQKVEAVWNGESEPPRRSIDDALREVNDSFDSLPVRDTGRLRGADPATVEGFLIVDDPSPAKRFALTDRNTIVMPVDTHFTGQDLTQFHQINNQFLRDVPHPTSAFPSLRELARQYRQSVEELSEPEIQKSNALAITGVRLANGEEVLTIFSLSDLAQTGAVRGEAYTASDPVLTGLRMRQMAEDSEGTALPPRTQPKTGLEEGLIHALGGTSGGRVYYYGDPLKKVDLAALCSDFGREVILRSLHSQHDLLETESRLQQIAERSLEKERLTIVNGLPESVAAVNAMGPLVGDPKVWLYFREKVDASLRDRAARHITTQEEFFNELSQGESDLLILVAHSTGSQLYLNGQATSIKELQALPSRTEKPERPRLAVLISCDAGKTNGETGLFGKKLPSLAQILIDKGFVDKVLAPDHKIGEDESLEVLRRALEGSRTQTIFKGWIPRAIDWLRASELVG